MKPINEDAGQYCYGCENCSCIYATGNRFVTYKRTAIVGCISMRPIFCVIAQQWRFQVFQIGGGGAKGAAESDRRYLADSRTHAAR